ncbi:hypothetical protein [Sphingomonas sp.]|uniref:hypothetical protein n=1 Tax=Sphingomonas sp. TaxID=28214 RepID=UPI0025DB3091|nr:hypothetical protein [Sphingomonas sp.]
MLEDRTTRLLARWIPVAVLANLSVALVAYFLHWPDAPVYLLMALTVAATIIAAIAFLGSVRGVRSSEALGFKRMRDALSYEISSRGIRPTAILLMISVVAVSLFCRLTDTASGLLAFFSFPLAGIYQAVTTRYPADRNGNS